MCGGIINTLWSLIFPMKTFQQFIAEAEPYDKEGLGHGTGLTHREVTRLVPKERKLHLKREGLKQ